MEGNAYGKLVVVAVVLALALGSGPIVANGLCGMSIDGFLACQPSVSNANPKPPSQACCKALDDADLPCLCTFKNKKSDLLKGVDMDRAQALPGLCNLEKSFHCQN